MSSRNFPQYFKTNLPRSFKDEAAEVAHKMLRVGMEARQPRLDVIEKIEKAYSLEKKKTLKGDGRHNVPLPILRGAINAVTAEVRDPVKLYYEHTDEQYLQDARRMTALAEKYSGPYEGNWPRVDRDSTKLAAIAGFNVLKKYAYREDGKFKDCLEVCDHFDIVPEPQGGQGLEKHLFKFQVNIFRDDAELKANAISGLYDPTNVTMLTSDAFEQGYKMGDEQYRNRANVLAALGVDVLTHSFVGNRIHNLAEGVFRYKGQWLYILMHYRTGVWLRLEPLQAVFQSGLSPWIDWHTDNDTFNFYNLGYGDEFYPIDDSMRTVFNGALDNLNRRNWDMTAVDPTMFPDPSKLKFSPDRIVPARRKVGDMRPLEAGIYRFQTQDTTGITVNLMEFLDRFVGMKSGVNLESQGQQTQGTVGIHFSNLQEAKKRLGLVNDSKKDAWQQIGIRFDWGVYEHLYEEEQVRILGPRGYEWVRASRKNARPDFTIRVEGANTENQVALMDKQEKSAALARVSLNPVTATLLSPRWLLETDLRNAGWTEDQVRLAQDVAGYGDEELLAEAARAIADIIAGKELFTDVKLNRNATPIFQEKIEDYAYDKCSTDAEGSKLYRKLILYSQAHDTISRVNMLRRARQLRMANVINGSNAAPGAAGPTGATPGGPGAAPGAPAPMTPATMPTPSPAAA